MTNPYATMNDASGDQSGWRKKVALFLGSQSLSMFGSMLVQYAITWHLTLTTQSGAVLTVATIAGFLPQIVLSLFAGVWADRYPRKRLIIGADLLTALSTLALIGFFLAGYRELWLILLISVIRSIGAGIQGPAVNALLPQIAPEDKLMRVNSINGTLQPVIMLAAPLLSGALLAYARLEAIFMVDVVTAALAVGLLLALQVPPLERDRSSTSAPGASEKLKISSGYFDDLRAGLAYIGRRPAIKSLFIFFAFVFFLVTPAAFLTPLLVARSYGEEVWRLTANEIAFFSGSILGGFILTAWGGFKNHFRTLGLSAILWALLFAGLGLVRDFNVYLGLMFLSGIGMPFFNTPTITLLQELVEPGMQGRVFGVQGLITSAVMPAGMLVFGPIADRVSIELVLVVTSLLMAVPGVWLFFNRDVHLPVIDLPAGDYDLQPGD